ncbi:MAG: CubicO group peptidase (beta-lactamase class C family) [Mariniblastus sp.]|jgi:CubicO group peptidase (beta-lactamase class C family)
MCLWLGVSIGPEHQLLAQTSELATQPTAPVSEIEAANFTVSDQAKRIGFDVKKLNSIDRKLTTQQKKNEFVGCSALVYCDGEIVCYGEWGFQNQRKSIPVNRDTIFRIYSMSKPITSVAAMQLVERGKLDLDKPVETYLPEFANLKVLDGKREVAVKRKMTTRDLMRHTSGLTYGFFGDTAVDKQYRGAGVLVTDLNLSTTVNKLAKIPLLYHPGTQFHYSASTDVLGRVVEVVSGQLLDEYLDKNVFTPLGMEDTFFSVPSEKQKRFAELYKPDGKGGLSPASPLQSIRFYNPGNQYFSGGGGLCSTIDDYLRFSKMLIGQGTANGNQILKPETLKQMFTNQLVDIERPAGRQFKFGLGFRIFPTGDYGWGGAAGTRFWVNPDKKMAILFMTQIMPYGSRGLGESVKDAVYSALR